MQDSKYGTKRSDLDIVRSMFLQNDIQSLMSNDEREKKVVIIPDHKQMGMLATKSMVYDVHMCDTMPAMVDRVMKKMNNLIYGESLFQKST